MISKALFLILSNALINAQIRRDSEEFFFVQAVQAVFFCLFFLCVEELNQIFIDQEIINNGGPSIGIEHSITLSTEHEVPW